MELNKIYNEECLEGMKKIEDKSVDMILCDLPYGTTACKWDTIIPFEELWEQYKRVIKDKGAIVLFGSEPFSSYLRLSNIKLYKYDLIWDKNKGAQPQLAKIQPMKSHENISIFGEGRITYNPQMEKGKPYTRKNKGSSDKDNMIKTLKPITQINSGYRYPKTIHKFSRDFSAQTRIHPTQKPIALFEYLIKTYSNEGETVLDNCMGSGTTAIACINTNRNYIGFELDEEYYNASLDRIKKHKEE